MKIIGYMLQTHNGQFVGKLHATEKDAQRFAFPSNTVVAVYI